MSLITLTEPQSAIAEAYQSLRTSLEFSSLEKPVRSILVAAVDGSPDEKTAPLVDYYKKQGLLNKVEGAEDPDRVSEKIRTLVSTLSLEEGS